MSKEVAKKAVVFLTSVGGANYSYQPNETGELPVKEAQALVDAGMARFAKKGEKTLAQQKDRETKLNDLLEENKVLRKQVEDLTAQVEKLQTKNDELHKKLTGDPVQIDLIEQDDPEHKAASTEAEDGGTNNAGE